MKYETNNITGRHHCPPVSNQPNSAHLATSSMPAGLKTVFSIFAGSRIFVLAALLAFAAALAHAADTPEATVAYRPGDTVRLFVTFKEPISLKYGDLRFVLNGELPDGQKVFANFFDLTTLVKSSEREYEFDAKVTDHMASGTYRLSFLAATDQADFSRNFNAGPDFPSVTLCIRNERHVQFPDIKTIRLGEPSDHKP